MRLQCSPMVKLILLFIQVGPIFFSSYYFFLISVSSISHSCSHFSALSLPLLDVSASLSNETQAGASSQVDLYCSGLFFFSFFLFFLLFFFIFFYFFSLWFDVKFGSGCVGYGFGILGCGLMCFDDFVGLGSWVWVCRFAFVDHWRDRRRSSTWSVSSARVIEREREREDEKNKNKEKLYWYLVYCKMRC